MSTTTTRTTARRPGGAGRGVSLILMLLLGLFALLITIYAVGAYLLPRGRGWEIAPAGILLLPLGLALLGYVSYRIYSMFRG